MDLEIEFKKLNYALKSYKQCNYTADYEHNKDEGSYTLMLLDVGEMPVLSHKVTENVTETDINKFKKEALKKCTHAS